MAGRSLSDHLEELPRMGLWHWTGVQGVRGLLRGCSHSNGNGTLSRFKRVIRWIILVRSSPRKEWTGWKWDWSVSLGSVTQNWMRFANHPIWAWHESTQQSGVGSAPVLHLAQSCNLWIGHADKLLDLLWSFCSAQFSMLQLLMHFLCWAVCVNGLNAELFASEIFVSDRLCPTRSAANRFDLCSFDEMVPWLDVISLRLFRCRINKWVLCVSFVGLPRQHVTPPVTKAAKAWNPRCTPWVYHLSTGDFCVLQITSWIACCFYAKQNGYPRMQLFGSRLKCQGFTGDSSVHLLCLEVHPTH